MKKNSQRKRNKIKSWTDLSDLDNVHEGRKCFICGAGPSIGFLDLTPIHNHVVIAINSSIMLMPWNDGLGQHERFWISNDTLCFKWSYFWTHVLRSDCTKIVRVSWKKHDQSLRGHNFRYFAPRETDFAPLEIDDGGLCSVSSVPTGIDLALKMGCKNIYLVGVDHRMTHGNSHFWQFLKQNERPTRKDKRQHFKPEHGHQEEMFHQNIRVFLALLIHAKSIGVNIYNCSYHSTLTVFPKITFERSYA